MLTLERCREILGPNCPLTYEELSALRDQLRVVADLALGATADGGDT